MSVAETNQDAVFHFQAQRLIDTRLPLFQSEAVLQSSYVLTFTCILIMHNLQNLSRSSCTKCPFRLICSPSLAEKCTNRRGPNRPPVMAHHQESTAIEKESSY